jgi:hypothetical protein
MSSTGGSEQRLSIGDLAAFSAGIGADARVIEVPRWQYIGQARWGFMD